MFKWHYFRVVYFGKTFLITNHLITVTAAARRRQLTTIDCVSRRPLNVPLNGLYFKDMGDLEILSKQKNLKVVFPDTKTILRS